ncbi:hypothetical protein BG004_005306 [Podila humilis]|nr:hypothetical protein BG004_005306 [Podila humilis]
MAGGKWMGWWGHLGAPKQRGIAIYALSPFEQRAFAGALHQAVFNTFRRVTGQIFYIGAPAAAGYALFSWGKENHPFQADGVRPSTIRQQAFPYIPPPKNFPPDQWGNRIPDFSRVGYRHGHVPLPIVPTTITLKPSLDPTVDDRARIQAAINYVSTRPLQSFTLRDGSTTIKTRGAVLLQAGFYRIAGALIINQSGVVLRGEGNGPSGTILIATGDFQHDFIYLHGLLDPSFQGKPEYLATYGANKKMSPKDPYVINIEKNGGSKAQVPVADEYIPAGTFRVPVKDIRPFRVQQEIIVERQAKSRWIDRIGASHLPPRPGDPSRTINWDARQFTMRYSRVITSIETRSRYEAKAAAKLSFTRGAQVFMAKNKMKKKKKAKGESEKMKHIQKAVQQQYAMSATRLELVDRDRRAYLGWGQSPLESTFTNAMSKLEKKKSKVLKNGKSHLGYTAGEDDEDDDDKEDDDDEEEEDDEDDEDEEQDEMAGEDDPRWIPGYLRIDIPLTMNMDPVYGSGVVYRLQRETPIPTDIGVENLALWSEHSPTNNQDERHAWFAVMIDHCEHCWAADIRTRYFVSGIKLASGSKHVTVQDCHVTDPVSLRSEGNRRYMYMLMGQMGLVKRCFASDARHDFITGPRTRGPNVFVDSEGIRANNDAGPHDRWSTGTLYDNVQSTFINVRNRGWMGHGQGWAGVFHVVYRSAATTSGLFQSPPGGTNWVIEFQGRAPPTVMFEGEEATFLIPTASDVGKIPRSLYWAQLVARMGGSEAVARRVENLVGVAGRNRYPSPSSHRPRQFAMAEEIQADEAARWPDRE